MELKNLKCEYCNILNKNIGELKNPKVFNSKYAYRCFNCFMINDK